MAMARCSTADPAGSVTAATNPGVSGDVPPFSSNVALTSGTLGGIGWRPGAEHIVLLATDTAPVTAFPNGTNPATAIITGADGVTVPATDLESTSGRVGYVSTSVGFSRHGSAACRGAAGRRDRSGGSDRPEQPGHRGGWYGPGCGTHHGGGAYYRP